MPNRYVTCACLILSLGVSGAAQSPWLGPGEVVGKVTDSSGLPLPRVTVTAEGVPSDPSRSVVTDSQGVYRLTRLPLGAYSVSTVLGGFRKATGRVSLTTPVTRQVDFTLSIAPFACILFAHPGVPAAYREAEAVAHVRIERTEPSEDCEKSMPAHHLALVISTVKGSVPRSVWLEEENHQFCRDRGELTGSMVASRKATNSSPSCIRASNRKRTRSAA